MIRARISLLTACMSMASLILVSGNTFAHKNYKENYKGQYKDACPTPLTLKGGLYFGMQAGYDMYRVVQDVDVTIINPPFTIPGGPTIPGFGNHFSMDPRSFPSGGIAGGVVGYGMYFEQFYNAYLGIEAFGNFSKANTDYEVRLDSVTRVGAPDRFNKFKTRIEAESNYGIDFIPGIKINPATLFYLRAGYNWTNIDIRQTIVANLGSFLRKNTTLKDLEEPGGFHYGVGMELAVMGNWSLRGEYTHTSFNNFDADNNNADNLIQSDVSASDNQFMLGAIYHLDWL